MKGQKMKHYQIPILEEKKQQLRKIAETIQSLNMNDEWIERFTSFCSYRGWLRVKPKKQLQMENIARTNSEAIKELIQPKGLKKVGLDIVEEIAIYIHDESIRRKAVNILLTKGAKKGYKDVLLLVAKSKHESQKS